MPVRPASTGRTGKGAAVPESRVEREDVAGEGDVAEAVPADLHRQMLFAEGVAEHRRNRGEPLEAVESDLRRLAARVQHDPQQGGRSTLMM